MRGESLGESLGESFRESLGWVVFPADNSQL